MTENKATFVFWDVQHGSACYIATPNGKSLVVDLGVGSYGQSNQTFSPLLYLKNQCNVQQLDGVIITHPHRDHLDDICNFDLLAPRVLHRPKHLSEQEVRAGNRTEDSDILNKYFEVNSRFSSPVSPENNPYNAMTNGGLDLQFFMPCKCNATNLNDHSIVTVASFAESKIIIPGDNEEASWNELLQIPKFIAAIRGADILVASHHGRESGYCDAIFEYFTPRLVIISDGPETETSATDKYCAKAKGWKVHKKSGESETKKCLTTRSNGAIVVELGMNEQTPFIDVRCD